MENVNVRSKNEQKHDNRVFDVPQNFAFNRKDSKGVNIDGKQLF